MLLNFFICQRTTVIDRLVKKVFLVYVALHQITREPFIRKIMCHFLKL